MYQVNNKTDAQYGNVVIIQTATQGIETPFFAMQQALKNKRLWQESGATRIRFLINGEIMSPKEMETWSHKEYKSLPKCPWCYKILGGDVFTHSLSTDIFCKQVCADQDYQDKCERLQDEQDIDL
jgi:hypothetical protein